MEKMPTEGSAAIYERNIGIELGQFSNYNSTFFTEIERGGEAGCYGPSREGMGP